MLVVALVLSAFILTSSTQLRVVTQHDSLLPSMDVSDLKVMRDANGNSYKCVMPSRSPQGSIDEARHAPSPSPQELVALLDSSLSRTCLLRQEGIWTFEACYKKGTRQLRKGVPQVQVSGGQATYTIEASPVEEFSCGQYHEDQVENQNIAVLSDKALTGTKMTYVSHHLREGAGCVMTGGNRTSEMRFTCGGGLGGGQLLPRENTLVLVKEFPTCHYIYVVSVPSLCSRFPDVFESKPQAVNIECFKVEPSPAESKGDDPNNHPHILDEEP